MVRPRKLLLWAAVVATAALTVAAYGGLIESVVSPRQLPGSPAVAPFVAVGLVFVGVLGSAKLDSLAWAAVGREAGLSRGDAEGFDAPPPDDVNGPLLGGAVDGRPVRAWTYTTGGQHGENRRYTLVAVPLREPVDWHATFGVDTAEATTVGEVGVSGDVENSLARDALTSRARDAVADVEGAVSVGDPVANALDDVLGELDGADGTAANLAAGVLNATTRADGDPGPARTVQHRAEGRVTEGETLRRRIEAAIAVADGVERAVAAR